MEILVIGATGLIGHEVARALHDRGASVRAASRTSADRPVDLTTGAGLADALDGADVVVDASNGPPGGERARPVLVDGTRRLLAAEALAGVRHHVAVSIVGIDAVPLPYYRLKLEQEALVAGGPVPWSVVRATQVHELVDGLLSAAARRRVAPRSRARLQPAAASEVGAAVAEVALGAPRGRVDVAGPEVRTVTELAALRRRAGRPGGVPVPVPLPRRLGRPLRAGNLTAARADVTTATSFERWLATSA